MTYREFMAAEMKRNGGDMKSAAKKWREQKGGAGEPKQITVQVDGRDSVITDDGRAEDMRMALERQSGKGRALGGKPGFKSKASAFKHPRKASYGDKAASRTQHVAGRRVLRAPPKTYEYIGVPGGSSRFMLSK